jgi:hypothetical protein
MAIIESIAESEPFSQGDIFQGIKLYASRDCSQPDDDKAKKLDHPFCLVVSRPCNCLHKNHVIVVPVEKLKDGIPKDANTFSSLMDFLVSLRDGYDSPYVFYLGEIDSYDGRFVARLDSFHTVKFPSEPTVLFEFVRDNRVGRLHVDFIRDLHLRIFRAFASLGFDDFGWFSDKDLNLAVSRGQADLAAAEAEVHGAQASMHAQEFANRPADEKRLGNAESSLNKIKKSLEPLLREQEKRKSKSTAPPEPIAAISEPASPST